MDREQAIEAITERARAHRPRSSRAMWIAAIVLGVACAIGFVVILVADGTPQRADLPAKETARGFGFSAGLALGVAAGIAIGYAIARRKTPDA